MTKQRLRPSDKRAGAGSIAGTAEEQRRFGAILSRKQVTSLYQPIISLRTGTTVAYEALARGPHGSPLESPDALFAAARRYGRLAELEWQCRAAAVRGALDADLGAQTSLFLNVEPSIVGNIMPPEVDQLFRAAERRLRLVLELTERDLCRRPAELLAFVQWARERWWGIALDDVGAEPESLALLPFLEPDVIKLDMRIVHEPPSAESERLLDAVRAEATRTGAVVLAEGIENEEHLARARELDVALVQGWYFGRPAPLSEAPSHRDVVPLRLQPPQVADTPFDVISGTGEGKRMPVAKVLELIRDAERESIDDLSRNVVLACFGGRGLFTPDIAARYADLAREAVFVGAVGLGLPQEPAPGVRSTPLDERDALAHQLAVAIVGPDRSVAVAARLPKGEVRPTDVVQVFTSTSRETVLKVGRLVMGRVVPAYR
ncbi:MAG: EAL domain-containing protein [Actinomycetota bacterium]